MPQSTDWLLHRRFGDLRAPEAVRLDCHDPTRHPLRREKTPYIHLSVTGRCQARCQGCVNAAISASFSGDRRQAAAFQDTVPKRDGACIAHLVRQLRPGPVVVCLYGGEPLLAMDKIVEVCQVVGQAGLANPIRYMIYTNGGLLGEAVEGYPGLLADIWLYSVSIDGRDEQHNRIRRGTNLNRIRTGLEKLKAIRHGSVLMWSTLREEQSLLECFEQFLELQAAGSVDFFFWHWLESPEPLQDLAGYADRYERDLATVMDCYLEWLEQGRILPVVHLNELITYLLSGCQRGSSACGVELAENFDLVDGRVHACADLPLDLAIGEIDETGKPRLRQQDLSFLVNYKEDLGCYTCGIHAYCGGRCPVLVHCGGLGRFAQYCQLMRLHVGTVKEYIPRITAAMSSNGITVQNLYDTSAYYAQFTDVTP